MNDLIKHLDAKLRDQTRATAQTTLKGAPAALLQLRRQYDAALSAARSYTNPDLTAEGLHNHRRQLVDRVNAEYRPRFGQLRSQVDSARDAIRQWAEETRPRLADSATALQRAQAGWDRVRSRLDAGMSVQQALRDATDDELLGAREWAPTYLNNLDYVEHRKLGPLHPFTPKDRNSLLRSIDAQLSQHAGGDAAKAVTALQDAEAASAEVTPWLQRLTAPNASHPDALSIAVESHFAAQRERASFRVDDDPEASRSGSTDQQEQQAVGGSSGDGDA